MYILVTAMINFGQWRHVVGRRLNLLWTAFLMFRISIFDLWIFGNIKLTDFRQKLLFVEMRFLSLYSTGDRHGNGNTIPLFMPKNSTKFLFFLVFCCFQDVFANRLRKSDFYINIIFDQWNGNTYIFLVFPKSYPFFKKF